MDSSLSLDALVFAAVCLTAAGAFAVVAGAIGVYRGKVGRMQARVGRWHVTLDSQKGPRSDDGPD